MICKLIGGLPGTDCHGDNLGGAKDAIDGSGLADWWEDAGFFRDFAICKSGSCQLDWARDWFKDNWSKVVEAMAAGDPHVVGFGGQAFDLLARGEFLYAAVDEGQEWFEVQARHSGEAGAAIITGLAFAFGEEDPMVVEIHSGVRKVSIDGVDLRLNQEIALLFDADGEALGAVVNDGDAYIVVHRNLHMARVWWSEGALGVNLYMLLDGDTGLHGALGGPANVLNRDGSAVDASPSYEAWVSFLDGWSVGPDDSLFGSGHLPFEVPEEAPSLGTLAVPEGLRERATELVADGSQWAIDVCLYDLIVVGDGMADSCWMYNREHGDVIQVSAD